MRLFSVRLAIFSTPLLLSVCVPYPVYKTLQPAAKVTVLDEQGQAIADAAVTLIAGAYPYGREESRDTKFTSLEGTAVFDSRREWQTELLALHGWKDYFWNWCVGKAGYTTFTTSHGAGHDFESELIVRLAAGESTPCP